MHERKKIKKVSLLFIALLIVALIWISLSDFVVRKNIVVSAPLEDVAVQLTEPENWKGWYPAEDGHQYEVIVVNPLTVLLKENVTNRKVLQGILVVPEASGKTSRVTWTQKVSFREWLADNTDGASYIDTALKNLKARVEDPGQRYGFPIVLSPVKDTLILTASQTIPRSSINEVKDLLRRRLISCINKNNIRRAGNYYFLSIGPGEDTVMLSLGMPVNHITAITEHFEFLKLPAQGRLLVGRSDVEKLPLLYKAMDRYLKDQGLKRVAQHFEKYNDDETPVVPAMKNEIELIYPVY